MTDVFSKIQFVYNTVSSEKCFCLKLGSENSMDMDMAVGTLI
jgi:hypothetical protein